MLFIKRSWCNTQVSIIIACKNQHDCIIDKTCIDRIIEHSTDCFHKEPFVYDLFVKCHLRSGSAFEIIHENSSFYMTLYKSISVQLLGMLLYSQL